MPLKTTKGLARVIQEHLDTHYDGKLLPFAKRAGVSRSYLIQLLKVERRPGQPYEPTVDSLMKIAEAMGITLEELMGRAGYFNGHSRKAWRLNELLDKVPKDVQRLLNHDDGDQYVILADTMRKEDIDPQTVIELIKTFRGRGGEN